MFQFAFILYFVHIPAIVSNLITLHYLADKVYLYWVDSCSICSDIVIVYISVILCKICLLICEGNKIINSGAIS